MTWPTVSIGRMAGNMNAAPAHAEVGIELELENVRHTGELVEDHDFRWDVTEDGSLRDFGAEFISPPVTLDEAESMLATFYDYYTSSDWTAGVRCGTHVHVNCLELTNMHVARVCTAYALVEPLFYDICGVERESNIYCVPWYRGPEEAEAVRELVQGHFSPLESTCKYSGLYLFPLRRLGTLEFRMAPVFDQFYQMKDWVRLCHTFVQRAATKWDEQEDIIDQFLRLGPADFVRDLLPAHLADDVLLAGSSDPEYLCDMWDTVSVAERTIPLALKVTDWSALSAPPEMESVSRSVRPRRREQRVFDLDILEVERRWAEENGFEEE